MVDIKGSSCYMDLETLNDKSLITILGRKLCLHDLLQEMGWRIVCRESFQEPGRHSRLWLCEDIFHVPKKNTVSGMVRRYKCRKVELGSSLPSVTLSNITLLNIFLIGREY